MYARHDEGLRSRKRSKLYGNAMNVDGDVFLSRAYKLGHRVSGLSLVPNDDSTSY
jgi:hypothetical protein